jgi:cellulose synthase/poly-beta-1,6-N-acetylglucosamine synthase-like glycosyltransferase
MQYSTDIGLSTGDLAVDLLASVLELPASEATTVLGAAQALGVDPLDHCSHRFGLSEAAVLSRAAAWAGLPFAPQVPHTVRGSATFRRLDSLADIRAIYARLDDVDLHFFAPRFDDLIKLRRRSREGAHLEQSICIVPGSAIRRELAEANASALIAESRQRLARLWPNASAHLDLPMALRASFALVLALVVGFAALAPFVARPLMVPFLLIVIVAPAALRLAAAFFRPPEQSDTILGDAELPTYSVLVPLRDEAGMVPQLYTALCAIDYPPEKLDVLFIVEATSTETVRAVEAILDDPRFELVVVPDALPHTKPKALDYALPLVRGELVVVYDAEDIPARNQLRLAASRFAARPEFDCLQAELVIENGAENWLTALFAGEYAGLFGRLLPLLAELRLPMPLGGTSNHFRAAALREVGGWDAFNVTEDADLGVRLARLRYCTGTLRSATAEEAPVALGAWMRQRTRWMKGWMQTFLVHNRRPREFLSNIGWRGFLFFQLYVGSLIVSSLLHTVFALTLAIQLALWGPSLFTTGLDAFYLLVLGVGYGGAFGLAIAGLIRQRQPELGVYQVLLPVYWLLHAFAAVRATVELLTRPYFWSKTVHGKTKMKRSA